MGPVIQGLAGICGIVELVCFIMILIKMFQNEQTVMAIVCIVFCWCFGGLLAFIMGWINNAKWGVKNVMLIWTVAFVLHIILAGVGAATGALDFSAYMPKT